MEDDSTFQYSNEKSCCTMVSQGLFSTFGLFLLVAGYAVFGAWAFIQFELDAENLRYTDKREQAMKVDETYQYTLDHMWWLGGLNLTDEERDNKIKNALTDYHDYIVDAVNNHNYDGTVEYWEYDWTFSKSLLFTMTIMSTIGYGHIAPKTFEGQIFCIFYSLIGCALFLVFLANLGDLMAKGFIYFYSRAVCRWFRSTRHESELPEGTSKRSAKLVIDDNVGTEDYMPTKELFVPITINIFVLHAYMIAGGILFSQWEAWSLTSSFYFTFITLSTVGFGDLVPGNSLLDGESLASQLKMISVISYIVVGMALLSMSITLMQQQIVEKCKFVAQEIGLTKNDSVEDAIRKNSMASETSSGALENVTRGASPYRRPSALAGKEGNRMSADWTGIPGTFQNK